MLYFLLDSKKDTFQTEDSAGRATSSPRRAQPTRVVDKQATLPDGKMIYWQLPRGSYKVEVKASSDDVSVTWKGADCKGSKKTRSFSTTCQAIGDAELRVTNPGLGLTGSEAKISVLVIRYP